VVAVVNFGVVERSSRAAWNRRNRETNRLAEAGETEAEDYLEGSARRTETVFGWNRKCFQLGLHERRTEILCVDNYQARGRRQTEAILPNLEQQIRSLVDAQIQADPKFQSTFTYSCISARAVREALLEQRGYTDENLPTRQTIGDILNRLGYRRLCQQSLGGVDNQLTAQWLE